MDLGESPDRGAGVRRGDVLCDGDRRAEPFRPQEIGAAEPAREQPRVRRHQLEEAPLPFAEERVERERRLSRPRDAGDDGQLPARDLEVEPGEVVLARAAKAKEGVAQAEVPRKRLLRAGRGGRIAEEGTRDRVPGYSAPKPENDR